MPRNDFAHTIHSPDGRVIALPLVIRYAVVEGIATATSLHHRHCLCIYRGFLIYGLLIYRSFDWRRLLPMLIETAGLSGAILLIIVPPPAWLGPEPSRLLARLLPPIDRASRPAPRPSSRCRSSRLRSWYVPRGIRIVLFVRCFPIARAVGVHEVHYAMIVHPRHGIGLFRPAVRSRLLCGLRHWRVDPARGSSRSGLFAGAAGRVDYRGDIPVDLDRVPISVNGDADECEAKPVRYRFGQDAAN